MPRRTKLPIIFALFAALAFAAPAMGEEPSDPPKLRSFEEIMQATFHAPDSQRIPSAFQSFSRAGYGATRNDLEKSASVFSASSLVSSSSNYSAIRNTYTPLYTTTYSNIKTDPILSGINPGPDYSDYQSNGTTIEYYGGIADDIDGNGNAVNFILVDQNNDGEFDDFIGVLTDYDDLYTFNVGFDEVYLKNELRPTSFELMKQHVLQAGPDVNSLRSGWRFEAFVDDWWFAFGDEVVALTPYKDSPSQSIRNNHLRKFVNELHTSTYTTYGLRAMEYEDSFYFVGRGSILGETSVAQENDHLMIGPQIGVGAVAETSLWRFEAALLGLAGYGNLDLEQSGDLGTTAIPGALNRPSILSSTSTDYQASKDYFAWHGEARLAASCQVTRRLRFDAAWRWMVTGPFYTASNSVVWNMPDWGIQEVKDNSIDRSDLFLGFTYTR
jgi:hypothetical protein